jgi:hypothetical protein
MARRNRDFYPPEATEASRATVQRVHAAVPDAVLIGGWATWMRTGGAMSHDIDLIVTRAELATLGRLADDVSESKHPGGRRWRGVLGGVHLDLYTPCESQLGGELQLRVERLVNFREVVDGWTLLEAPAHVATRFAALLDRPDSLPGEKDRQEIAVLLAQGVDSLAAVTVLHDASARPSEAVTELVARGFGYLDELTIDRPARLRLKELGREWIARSQTIAELRRVVPERSMERGGRGHER